MKISAAEFKAKCLKLMDHVNSSHEEIVITKHGRPVARVLPVSEKADKPAFGYLKGTVSVNGDLIFPIDGEWNADKR